MKRENDEMGGKERKKTKKMGKCGRAQGPTYMLSKRQADKRWDPTSQGSGKVNCVVWNGDSPPHYPIHHYYVKNKLYYLPR